MERKDFLLGALPAIAGLGSLSFLPKLRDRNDEDLLAEVNSLEKWIKTHLDGSGVY